MCVIYSTYGRQLWTSTEYNYELLRSIFTYNGRVDDYRKGDVSTIRRVRTYSTYGNNLWSSCEYSQKYAGYLITIDGDVTSINKTNNYTHHRVRAFLSLFHLRLLVVVKL